MLENQRAWDLKTERILLETEKRNAELQRDVDVLNSLVTKENDPSNYMYGGAYTS